MRSRILKCLMIPVVTMVLAAQPPAKAKDNTQKPYQIGKASWYGKAFNGKTTANGETYNMFEFTAAHRELPLGTWVKVTNLRNGRWVIVRINDRGPVPETRVIDLSYGAAQMLDASENGLVKVKIEILDRQTPQVAENLAGGE
jgi:peptidoglycan lytic transglycosylase